MNRGVCRKCWAPIHVQYRSLPYVAPYSQKSGATRDIGQESTGDSKLPTPQDEDSKSSPRNEKTGNSDEPGAMTRRLQEATEEALFTGGRAGHQAVEAAGFSEELREKLLNKVQDAKFRQKFSSAFTTAGLPGEPGSSGTGIGGGAHQAWTGEERTEDAVLRMLEDAKKPMKSDRRGTFQPPPVDMRIKRDPILSPGRRIVNARDKASSYSNSKTGESSGMTDDEKAERTRHFRERFEPGSRSMPNSISGLAALANEKIENAIARGQFKDIPRGPGVERDTRADNAMIDTTEYLMNKMIQRQDMVPPWIEKQQDLVKAAHSFRTRLRNDWRRHASRSIAARGGTLLEQIARAEENAESERAYNPRLRKTEDITVTPTDDPVMVSIRQPVELGDGETLGAAKEERQGPLPPPFRDPSWEQAENAYLQLSIDHLNKITRAYNLMAPDLAKKPYYSLQRELLGAFADAAPQLAKEIKDRATRAPSRSSGGGAGGAGGLFDYVGGPSPRIHLEADEKAYGFKEWWRDFWSRKGR